MPSTHSTHPSLLRRLRDAGDETAWREFDERYRDLILRYCYRRGLQYWDAEDVRQVVMAGLLRALEQFRYDPARGSFRSYLGRAVNHAVARHFRRPDQAMSGLDADADADQLALAEADPDDALQRGFEREWRAHHLRLALDHLRANTQDKTMHILERLLDGQDVTQIADQCAMSLEAVYKASQRLRERLRERIAIQLCDEEAPGQA